MPSLAPVTRLTSTGLFERAHRYNHLPFPALQAVAISRVLVDHSQLASMHGENTPLRSMAAFQLGEDRPTYETDKSTHHLHVHWPFIERCERATADGQQPGLVTRADYIQFALVNYLLSYYLGELIGLFDRKEALHECCDEHGRYDAYGFKTWLKGKHADLRKAIVDTHEHMARKRRERRDAFAAKLHEVASQ